MQKLEASRDKTVPPRPRVDRIRFYDTLIYQQRPQQKMGERPRRPRSTGARNSTGVQTKWDFYHWNETKVNYEGESLRACMERYGVGGWYSEEKDMVAALVFLSADKTATNSWLLGIKHLDDKQEVARMYEDDPRAYHLSLATSLGAHITSVLAGSVFEKL